MSQQETTDLLTRLRDYDSREHPDNVRADAAAYIERLHAALDRLARLGNEPGLGNSRGNMIAREALGL